MFWKIGIVSTSTRLGLGQPSQTLSTFNSLSTVGATAGWGLVRRNASYVGPAVRIADLNTDSELDVPFNSDGVVALTTLPYGDNTRVIRIYDQWGTDDLTCAKTAGISLKIVNASFNYSRIVFTGSGYLSTGNTANNALSTWANPQPAWACGIIRTENSTLLRTVWGIQRAWNYMSVGLWVEYEDLHYRINGSSPLDWSNTDWNLNPEVQNSLSRLIGDNTQGDNAGTETGYGYHNGISVATRTYSGPMAHSNYPLTVGGGLIGSPWIGEMVELHLFNKVSPLSTVDRTYLDDAMSEISELDPPTGDVWLSVLLLEGESFGDNSAFLLDGDQQEGLSALSLQGSYA